MRPARLASSRTRRVLGFPTAGTQRAFFNALNYTTVALKKIDAAASLLRVAHAVAEASVRYLQLKFVHGCVSFLAARMPAATASPSHMYTPCFVFP